MDSGWANCEGEAGKAPPKITFSLAIRPEEALQCCISPAAGGAGEAKTCQGAEGTAAPTAAAYT